MRLASYFGDYRICCLCLWAAAALLAACAASGRDGDQNNNQNQNQNDNSNSNGNTARCGDGVVDEGEECDDGNTVADDGCDALCQLTGCGTDCTCESSGDVTDSIDTNTLFLGTAADGIDVSAATCGAWEDAKELYVSFTPTTDGDLVLSTVHPTTNVATLIEVRDGDCAGTAVQCAAGTAGVDQGSRVTVAAIAGETLVAMVETEDDASGTFALSLHPAGVCEGLGVVEDITDDLLSGRIFTVDTTQGTASQRGSCSAARDANPEALLTFTAPTAGRMVATSAHPDTEFNTLLYVREGRADGETYCDSPGAELVCANDNAPWGDDAVLHFDVVANRTYSLFVDGGSADGRGRAAVVLGYAQDSPTSERLEGCDHDGIKDTYAVLVAPGHSVTLQADTVDHATAADLRMRIRNPNGTELHEADDDFACTYPPPEWECPRYQFTSNSGGLYTVEIYVGASEECRDPSHANYQLSATDDGVPAELILVRDE